MSQEKVKVVEVEQTCGGWPAQWEGRTDDGRWIYARYRHGCLGIGVGATLDEAVVASFSDDALVSKQIGERLDGEMSWAELRHLTAGVIEWPDREPSWYGY